MKDNVVPIGTGTPPAAEKPAFPMPKHFRGKDNKALRSAWNDLTSGATPELLTAANRFTFEFAAILMAKFRRGDAMTATESKELRRLLGVLGLAKDEDAKPPKGKLSKYLGG